MAGLRSPLIPLGISAPVVTQGGVRSLLAPWIGGAAAPVAQQAGCRSLLAFWMGGVCAPPYVPPIPPAPTIKSGKRNKKRVIEEEFQENEEDLTLALLVIVNTL